MKRVVVTGVGAITPIGDNYSEFAENLYQGKNGVGEIKSFDASHFKTKFACELNNYDPKNHFDRKEIKKYDLFTQYALIACKEAIEESAFESDTIDRERIGVIWGSGNGGIQTFQDQVLEFGENKEMPRFSPFFIPRILADIASGVISIEHDFRGVNYTAIAACASATTAIVNAYDSILLGKADIIVAGGSEAAICESTIGGFGSLKALSTNEDIEKASRPLDKDRDGFVMGEGAGALILEEYEHAVNRGANILCEVKGGGLFGDAYHLTGTHPEGRGAIAAMKAALSQGNVKPEEIDYINLHATSTPIGDISEMTAVKEVFGENENISLAATKSMTGHLLGAAGAIEALACVDAITNNRVHPIINTENIDDKISSNYHIPLGKGVEKNVKYALNNTFGFGGHIASVLFSKVD